VNDYRLPTECYDIIFYTGQEFIGRDVLLIQSSDAVISVGGRIGTTHEFAVAMELGKPVGVLHGAGGTSDMFDDILRMAGEAGYPPLVHGDDPDRLVEDIIHLLEQKQEELSAIRRAHLELERQVP